MSITFNQRCDELAQNDPLLRSILDTYGYPPFWSRPNTFESLVQIILEQQVSLASAKAAYIRLKDRLGDVTPKGLLNLSDDELKAAYFSRQKIAYTKGLAAAVRNGALDLNELEIVPDEEVRARLTALKGIGDWTVDVYLIEVLHRPDVFPAGDIAAVRALKEVSGLDVLCKEEAASLAHRWQPHRTVATILLWHHYLASRGRSGEMLALS